MNFNQILFTFIIILVIFFTAPFVNQTTQTYQLITSSMNILAGILLSIVFTFIVIYPQLIQN